MDVLHPLHAVPGFLNMYHLNHPKYPKALIAINHRCGVSNPKTFVYSNLMTAHSNQHSDDEEAIVLPLCSELVINLDRMTNHLTQCGRNHQPSMM